MPPFRIVEHQVPCSYVRGYRGALAASTDDQLYLAVKQYIPIDNPNPRRGDVSIVGAHANGFPKELYEPLWEDLLAQSKKHSFRIRSIWIADVAHGAASGILNEHKLGNDPSWFDHARDLTYFLNLYRKEIPQPIFGLGHSMGGNNLVNVALFNPRLFTGLILVDPVIQPRTAEIAPPGRPKVPAGVAVLSTFRRDIWPSREEAKKLFLKSPFYKAWNPRVFDRWIDFGLRDCPTVLHPEASPPQVTLATTVANEVHTFLRPNYEGYGLHNPGKRIDRSTHPDLDPQSADTYPFYRSEAPMTFKRLPELRPSALYIFGSESDVSNEELNQAKLKTTGVGIGGSGGQTEGRVKSVTLAGIGHLIAMEAPERTAIEAASWIEQEMVRWMQQQEEWEREWSEKSLIQKQGLTEKWKEMMGGDPRKKRREANATKL